MSDQDGVSHARMIAPPFELSTLNELYRGKLVSSIIVIIPYKLALTLSIISSKIYTRLAVCKLELLIIYFEVWGFDIPSDGYFFHLYSTWNSKSYSHHFLHLINYGLCLDFMVWWTPEKQDPCF